eukprot:gnl/TRDRNA2_/TRDRNA2_150056_c0_seq1.p1 gnl/TRDRNA2_/TRDRNA2_150056_c0~~gnl/TRDRNA2_/TRDRNA2_150056_c0_seq1.p1  ORF type:complete len:331 (+),score=57.69 gnl/TRDRNA2_/TRDRNA2_150056_c0_seq1:438-1430(+)
MDRIRNYFEGKVVWITGASSGLGEALCISLCRQTQLTALILSARRENELERVKQRCLELQPTVDVAVLPVDLSKLDILPEVAGEAESLFGRVDVLFNNAGVGFRGLAVETGLDLHQLVMNVNFLSGVALVTALLPGWHQRSSGHVVQIAGVQGFIGLPGRAAMSAAKHAAVGFYDSLRAEVAGSGVTVTLVAPGYIATEHGLNAVSAGAQIPEAPKGLPPEVLAPQILEAVADRKPEFVPAALDAKVAMWLRTLFPRLLFWAMERRAEKEREERASCSPSTDAPSELLGNVPDRISGVVAMFFAGSVIACLLLRSCRGISTAEMGTCVVT